MSKLSVVSGKEVIKALQKIGYYETRQKGSHIRLNCLDKRPITVPNHKVISRGLLKKIIRDAEISVDEFLKIISK